jgi:hypothetical protein
MPVIINGPSGLLWINETYHAPSIETVIRINCFQNILLNDLSITTLKSIGQINLNFDMFN